MVQQNAGSVRGSLLGRHGHLLKESQDFISDESVVVVVD
jgi:hypothetical protein